MKWHRIQALLIRNLYLYQRSLPRIMDIFYWPVMELLLWGFLSLYLDKLNLGTFNVVTILLGALIFWDLLSQAQRTVSVAFLEDIWERNLLNIFVTPLKVSEFLISTMFLGLVRIIMVGVVMGLLAFLFYKFNILQFGFYLIPFLVNLLLFGWALGLFTVGIILRYGTSAQVLAFGFIFLIQPFSAVFYPVSALPGAMQVLAYILPSTYVFEGMRAIIMTGAFPTTQLGLAFVTNVVYIILSVAVFYIMFGKAKERGALMKLDT